MWIYFLTCLYTDFICTKKVLTRLLLWALLHSLPSYEICSTVHLHAHRCCLIPFIAHYILYNIYISIFTFMFTFTSHPVPPIWSYKNHRHGWDGRFASNSQVALPTHVPMSLRLAGKPWISWFFNGETVLGFWTHFEGFNFSGSPQKSHPTSC